MTEVFMLAIPKKSNNLNCILSRIQLTTAFSLVIIFGWKIVYVCIIGMLKDL